MEGLALGGFVIHLAIEVHLKPELLNFCEFAVCVGLCSGHGGWLVRFPLLQWLEEPFLGLFDLVDDSAGLFSPPGSASVFHSFNLVVVT